MYKNFIAIGDLIEIYSDTNSETFNTGKVLAINEDELIVESFNMLGEDDGILYYELNSVNKIKEKTLYLKKMKRLIQRQKLKEVENIFSGDLKESILRYAKVRKQYIEIQLSGSNQVDVEGFILEIGDEICVVEEWDFNGEVNGIVYIAIENITSMLCNGRTKRIYSI